MISPKPPLHRGPAPPAHVHTYIVHPLKATPWRGNKRTNKQARSADKQTDVRGLRNSHSVETERNRRSSDWQRHKSHGLLAAEPGRLFVRVHESKLCGSSDDGVFFDFVLPFDALIQKLVLVTLHSLQLTSAILA